MEWRSTRMVLRVMCLSCGYTVRFKLMCTRAWDSEIHDHALAVAQVGRGNRRNKKGTLQVRLFGGSAPKVEIDGHEA